MTREILLGVQPRLGGAFERIRGDDGARVILGSVDTVSVAGNRIDIRQAIQMHREGEQEFRIAPAAPGIVAAAPDRHGRLPARDKDTGFRRGLVMEFYLPGHGRHDGGDILRLAFDCIAEDDRRDAVRGGNIGGGGKRHLRGCDHFGPALLKDRMTRLRRFGGRTIKIRVDGRWNLYPVFLQHRAGIAGGCRIGHGRTRGNHRRIIARHVGDHEGDDFRRMGGNGEPPALDGGEMLTQGIHLGDIGAGGQQGPGDRLFLLQCNALSGFRE